MLTPSRNVTFKKSYLLPCYQSSPLPPSSSWFSPSLCPSHPAHFYHCTVHVGARWASSLPHWTEDCRRHSECLSHQWVPAPGLSWSTSWRWSYHSSDSSSTKSDLSNIFCNWMLPSTVGTIIHKYYVFDELLRGLEIVGVSNIAVM